MHGILRPTVVHPADYTFKLPDNVSLAAGAMVEPLAVGVHAATKAQVQPGDLAVVIGAGPIGMVTVLAALAAGCARVIVSDVHEPKLELARRLGAVETVNVRSRRLTDAVMQASDGWGADVVFECSGYAPAAAEMFDLRRTRPGRAPGRGARGRPRCPRLAAPPARCPVATRRNRRHGSSA